MFTINPTTTYSILNLQNFRQMRRRRLIGPFVSIHTSHLQRTVYIHTDGGRLCRPYIIVENGLTLVKQIHIDELNGGLRKFEDFLCDGKFSLDCRREHANFNVHKLNSQV